MEILSYDESRTLTRTTLILLVRAARITTLNVYEISVIGLRMDHTICTLNENLSDGTYLCM